MKSLEPDRKIMEDQEEISGYENRVDGQLHHERPQRVGFLFFGRRDAGHLPLFAVGLALGRAWLGSGPDFYLRPRGFFLPSSSLLAEEYGRPRKQISGERFRSLLRRRSMHRLRSLPRNRAGELQAQRRRRPLLRLQAARKPRGRSALQGSDGRLPGRSNRRRRRLTVATGLRPVF